MSKKEKEKEPDQDPKLELLLATLKKDFGAGAVVSFDDEPLPGIEFTSSGSIGLDRALGGGYARGRIIEAYGTESAGKTTLALHAIAEAQKQGLRGAFVDAEHALDLGYARNLGVDTGKLLFSQPDSGEDALQICEAMARSGAVGLIAVDSVAALVPRAEIEGDIGDQLMGAQARLMSQAMRKLSGACFNSSCAILFLNQIRLKIGVVYGNPETQPGGQALKFFTSQRLEIRKQKAIEEEGTAVANPVRVKVVKNKVAPPYRLAELVIRYGEGIDRIEETLRLGSEAGVVEKSGTWYSFDGERLGQGESAVREVLLADPAKLESIRARIYEQRV